MHPQEVAAVAGGAHPARMLRGLAGGLAAAARGDVRPGGGGWAGLQRRGMQLQVRGPGGRGAGGPGAAGHVVGGGGD